MSDLMDQGFDNVHKYEREVLKQTFPNCRLAQSFIFGSPEKQVKSFNGKLSSIDLFKDTIYEYTGDGLFLHFTSLPILSVILNAGFLRMSDFNCLSDSSEFNFASELLINTDEKIKRKIEEEKNNLFCLSACQSNSDTVHNEIMWKEYADNGKGCAIEFKFSSMEISNMSIGQIQYGKRRLTPIKKVKKLAEQFYTKNDFQVQDLPFFLSRISSFHKATKFSRENEVRLLFHKDGSIGNDGPHLNEYSDFYKSNQVRNFIKIYLKGRNKYVPYPGLPDKDSLGASPQIEISRIILGPNVTNIFEIVPQLLHLKTISEQNFEIWKVDSNQDYFEINC